MNNEIKELTNEYRINYYTNNLNNLTIEVNKDEMKFKYDVIFLANKDYLENNKHLNGYFKDITNYFSHINSEKYFFCIFGDNFNNSTYPCFIKTREINNNHSYNNNILLKLNTNCHTSMLNLVSSLDIPFNKKNNKLLWRGSSTGNNIHGLRTRLVKKFQNHPKSDIDIKFTKLVQGCTNNNEYIISDNMSYQEQLKSKFIISIEGNDVASNLKWLLLSKSVVLMPIPKICSWFMEDHLQPFIHFVPLKDDFTDLEEKYNWCLNNLDDCEKISQNATKYIQQFMDEKKEKEITTKVIEKYLEKINIIVKK